MLLRLAVSISTFESPIYIELLAETLALLRISVTIEGSGFVGIPSRCPNIAMKLMCFPK